METLANFELFFGGMTGNTEKKHQKLAKNIFIFGIFVALCVLGVAGIARAQSVAQVVPSFQDLDLAEPVMSATSMSLLASHEQQKFGFPQVEHATPRVIKTYKSQVTVYNSVPWQTDGDPWTTAAGTRARDGIVAANCLPFGTKLRIPELFGEKVFVVEDRLHPRKTCYIIDVWQEYSPDAKSFGAPLATVEILQGSPRNNLARR